MAQIIADVVRDTTTTTGTGAKTLANVAPLHHQTLAEAGAVTGDTVYLRIAHATLDEWEIGNYTYNSTGPTVTRIGAPLSSSNAGAAVDFSAGTKNVFHVMPADAQGIAAEVTPLVGAPLGTDTTIIMRGAQRVPYEVTLAELAAFFGAAPTAPAALTVGQWTAEATLVTGQMGINIVTLPSNGGSAITALEYRVGTGAAIALSGTGTGLRTVTAGFTAGVAVDIQVRAVNAIGAGAWSDVKNRTPLAGGGGGTASWQSFSVTAEGTTLTPAAPSGLVASDLQVAVIFGVPTADGYTGPAGWTLAGSVHTGFAGGTGLDVWTASGSTAQGTWTFTGGRVMEIHRISGASGVRAIEMREANTFVRAAGGFWLDWPNMPSPDATAAAGDAVLAVYYGPQNTHAFGTPPTDYTRATSRTAPNTQGTMYRSNVPAGATGVLAHGVAAGAYEERASATIILAAA
jgi:hypothetical protein